MFTTTHCKWNYGLQVQILRLTALLKATEPNPGRLKMLAGSRRKAVSFAMFKFSSCLSSSSSSYILSPKRSGVLWDLLRVPHTSEIFPLLPICWDSVSYVPTYITSESRRTPVRLRMDFFPFISTYNNDIYYSYTTL